MRLNIKRLKAERVAKGLSQEEMANKMGWSSRTPYVKRELGTIDIGVDEFLKMVKILGYNENNLSIFFTEDVPERERINSLV
nr:MAG TPA: helix-turn-helix domain protein [Caudoviricetes sp.]